MSTSAFVGKENPDGTVTSITVYSDGYPQYMFKMLKKNYSDPKKVDKLIALGDCSCIEKEVDVPEGVKHTFDEPVEGITIAYHRDRGEDWEDVKPMENVSEETFRCYCGNEYWYLFKNGEWLKTSKK